MKTIVTELTRLYRNRGGEATIEANATTVDILALLYAQAGGEEEIPAGATSADVVGMIADLEESEEPTESTPEESIPVPPVVTNNESAEINPTT